MHNALQMYDEPPPPDTDVESAERDAGHYFQEIPKADGPSGSEFQIRKAEASSTH